MIPHRAPQRYDPLAEDAWRAAVVDAITRLEQLPTGWTAWTGTAVRSTQNADAPPTLTQVAQAVKALIDDLVLRVKT
jgi:hypothetical protein